ncbi:DUF1481 domain-containing protein [Vibrio aquimaris]|uniref:DUF1481 domain-containing protein n=1 Tax=Vibrio aquimaris TaxID=2587862 RepID=A0A5P9CNA5_9VIBR|nr:DUF1481 domain-containing protein [Vibrio aquimaris]QFT27451.1 hypothetical protein FIV01_13650 [Vibrio aquimaris]
MKNFLVSSLITCLILGCSTSSTLPNKEQYSYYTGGKSAGDATSLYWYTEKSASPSSAADYVTAGDYGWYHSDYRWSQGKLREMIREGERLKNDALVNYRIHIRFNKDGEAIYQHYRLDGKVLPIKPTELVQYVDEAKRAANVAKAQDKKGFRLIQGFWDGDHFETCEGKSYDHLEFNQTLPAFVVNRLSDVENYVAFVGSRRNNSVVVEDLLLLSDDGHKCVERPSLLKEDSNL